MILRAQVMSLTEALNQLMELDIELASARRSREPESPILMDIRGLRIKLRHLVGELERTMNNTRAAWKSKSYLGSGLNEHETLHGR